MNLYSSRWMRVALFNLVIVALLGTVMRYKIGFEFPWLNQKYLQEAHSHFAFTGWITHSLFFLIAMIFSARLDSFREKTYRRLIQVNLVTAYGMLISFAIQGYGPVSLAWLALSMVIAYVFSYVAFKDAFRLPLNDLGRNWFLAAIIFGVISTLGTIILSLMMATRQYDQTTYLGSVYFYLHFQYNGWFFFACMGIFLDRIRLVLHNKQDAKKAFWLFFLSGIPAFFLSTLWAKLPVWLYAFVVLAALSQVAGWFFFLRLVKVNLKNIKSIIPRFARMLFIIAALGITLKIFLQLGSVIPAINQYAFGFRPIVIAYLHLVLLLITSLFLLAHMYGNHLLINNLRTRVALAALTTGIILNEVVLCVQGIGSFSYTIIPFAPQMLFGIAALIFLSTIALFWSQMRKKPDDHNQSVT